MRVRDVGVVSLDPPAGGGGGGDGGLPVDLLAPLVLLGKDGTIQLGTCEIHALRQDCRMK